MTKSKKPKKLVYVVLESVPFEGNSIMAIVSTETTAIGLCQDYQHETEMHDPETYTYEEWTIDEY